MDYVTRDELRQVENDLRRALNETERVLRAEFVDAIRDSEQRLHGEMRNLDDHLTEQDKLISARFDWPAGRIVGVGALLSFLSWVLLYALHIH